MPTWKGDINNPAPNTKQEPINRAEKIIEDNRAMHVRRDKDTQRDFTISLYDVDETILNHLNGLQLQVESAGKKIVVPAFYGSPERWTSAQRDGYIRDNQGKIILPAIILKRTSSESDSTLKFFNRYLNTSARKMYSEKNKYTKFSTLMGQNVPVNEIYNVVIPSHMLLTYHFIMWTDLAEQMNTLVENIQFNTRDYWGTKNGFKFRASVETFSHVIELEADGERIVKTEFDLQVHAYILPDTMTKLESHSMTTAKMFSPKKMIISAEVVATDFNMQQLDENREKWRNQNYPNLQKDVPIPVPPVTIVDSFDDSSISAQIVSTLRSVATQTNVTSTTNVPISDTHPYLRVVPTPSDLAASGENGYCSFDDNYFYIYSNNGWRKVAISQFT